MIDTPGIRRSLLRRSLFLTLLSFVLGPIACGADIDKVEINRDGRRYILVSSTHFDATPEQVFAVLIDYDQLASISKTIKESRSVEPGANGEVLVFTRIGACVLFFCKTVRKVEQLEVIRPRYIRATAIPDRSNVRYSRSEWKLAADDRGGTQVIYRLEFEPDFWVPPLIGPALIKHAVIGDGNSAVEQIEALARQRDPGDTVSGT